MNLRQYTATLNNGFMVAAKEQAQLSGCIKQQVGAVIVKDGHIVGFGNNGCAHPQTACPRETMEYKSGDGYHLCWDVCHQWSHAEINALGDALADKEDLEGATLYLYGHWYCCPDCMERMKEAGIASFHLMDGAKELFMQ